MLKQKFSQKLLQKLSPQQIQLMKLFQVPTAQLEQRIKEELEINPALEEGKEEEEEELEEKDDEIEEDLTDEGDGLDDDIDLTDYMSDDEVADYKLHSYGKNDEEKPEMLPVMIKTFQDYLLEQLGLLETDEQEEILAQQLIGSIDEDGYLRRPLISIVDDLILSLNVVAKEEDLERVLLKIQEFDPAGVGARDLKECLLLQIERKDEDGESIKHASIILMKHYDAFTRKQYDKLQKELHLSKEQLKEAIDIILKLNPKPGSAYIDNSKTKEYVIPDFIVTNDNGELVLNLNNRNVPELRVSRNYKDMIQDYGKGKKKDKKQRETIVFIKQKLDAARWFIDALQERQNTLMSTMQAMMEYQQAYFLTGDEGKLKPMKLKNVSDKTGYDMSTISRVSNSKYVQTEFGTFSLKYFFSEGMITESGEEVSTKKVKQIIIEFMEKEDKSNPLTDEQLKKIMKEKGYNLARRTIAKYREHFNIPVARLRKEL